MSTRKTKAAPAAAPAQTPAPEAQAPAAEATTAIEGEVLPPPAELIVQVAENPSILYQGPKIFEAWFNKLKSDLMKEVPDTSSAKGRDAIRKLAADVGRTRKAVNDTRLELTEEHRRKVAEINKAGAGYVEKLEELQDEIRQPLTDWEAAEEVRRGKVQETLDRFKADGVVTLDDTSETVAARLTALEETSLDPELFQELLPVAQQNWAATIETLTNAQVRLKREEDGRAELERFRQQEAERQAERDRLAQEAAEAAAAAEEARAAEAERLRLAQEAEMAELRRQLQEAKDAKDKAEQAAADAAAEAERIRLEREAEQAKAAEIEQLAAAGMVEEEEDRHLPDDIVEDDDDELEAEGALVEEAVQPEAYYSPTPASARRTVDASPAMIVHAAMQEAIASMASELAGSLDPDQASAVVHAIADGRIDHLTFTP